MQEINWQSLQKNSAMEYHALRDHLEKSLSLYLIIQKSLKYFRDYVFMLYLPEQELRVLQFFETVLS